MARTNMHYSLKRRDKKLAGVCSTLGDVLNVDPTFIRIGFVAAAVLISWKLTLIAYVAAGIYLAVQRNRANKAFSRRSKSDFERMEDVGQVRPSIKAMRTELDETDRRLMAIDHHINSQNDELAREIEALREEK
jgi:phage shock protein C